MAERAAASAGPGLGDGRAVGRSAGSRPASSSASRPRSALLLRAGDVDDESYALTCEALAAFDLRDAARRVRVPLLVVAGEHDPVVPTSTAEATAVAARARFEVMPAAPHLPPAEVPQAAAELLPAVREPVVQEAVRD